jgi:hypothetical protein
MGTEPRIKKYKKTLANAKNSFTFIVKKKFVKDILHSWSLRLRA